jgi:hypothetical protein
MSIVMEVATKLTMVDGVSGVLAGIAKQVANVNVSITSLERQLGGLNRGALLAAGSLSMLGGVAVLAGLKNLADHGDKLLVSCLSNTDYN